MKHIQPFVLFESRDALLPSGLTKKQEGFLNIYVGGTWSVNPSTGLVDIQGNFNCNIQSLNSLSGISFGHVSGYFYCSGNHLTSLEGAPRTVGGDFYCNNNQLTSLAGAPQKVGGDFYCYKNQLKSLKGAPQTVGGDFSCSANQLTFLEGAPQKVNGNFRCHDNQLTSLEGAPQTVGGNFSCHHNQLTSLEGAPRTVGDRFYCSNNKLTSLKGAPHTVGSSFDCDYNRLTSLEGAPQEINRRFLCDEFELIKGKWNMEGWLEVLNTGSEEAKKLILTLNAFNAEYFNNKLKEQPKETILQMVSFWDDLPSNIQDEIQIPSNLKDGFDNLLDLERAGIF